MAPRISLLVCGSLLTILIVSIRSAPIDKNKQIFSLSPIDSKLEKIQQGSNSILSTNVKDDKSMATIKAEENKKRKRQIQDENPSETFEFFSDDEENSDERHEENFHTTMRETSGKNHKNDETEIDDSKIFSDLEMNPSELATVGRERRDLRLNNHDNRRRKRSAFSPYEFYETDEIYDPWLGYFEEDRNVRPSRSFAPIFWFPPMNKRSFAPTDEFLDENVQWNPDFSLQDENEDEEEILNSLIDEENEDEDEEEEDDDDQTDFEYGRFPILIDLSKNPFDNFQLQQNYNDDRIPIDDGENEIFDQPETSDDEQLEQYPIVYEQENPNEQNYKPFEKYFYF